MKMTTEFKMEDLVMQEMNWASNQSQQRELDDKLDRLLAERFKLTQEQIRLERWFLDRKLNIPKWAHKK